MATLNDFLPYVVPYVQGCASPVAIRHIRDVCIDFCRFSSIVQATLDPVDVVAGEPEYDIDPPNGTDVSLVLKATYQARPLRILGDQDADFINARQTMGTPAGLKQGAGNTFMLDVAPSCDAAQAIAMTVATKPKRTANTVADVLLNDYGYEIGQGVVGRLLMIRNQPFSAPPDAPAYSAPYMRARVAARIRAAESFGKTSARVQPRSFI